MQQLHYKTPSKRGDRITRQTRYSPDAGNGERQKHRIARSQTEPQRRLQDTLLGWMVLEKGDSQIFDKLSPVVEHLLSTLSPREAAVLRQRYGIDDGYPKEYEDVGSTLQLATYQVKELEESALSKLYRRIMMSYGTIDCN